MVELKDYQKRSLDALESYLRLAGQHGAKMAFLHQTDRPYRSVPQLPGLPDLRSLRPTLPAIGPRLAFGNPPEHPSGYQSCWPNFKESPAPPL